MPQQHFTLEEADALVPWLESVFAEIDTAKHDMEEQQRVITELSQHSRSNGSLNMDSEFTVERQKMEKLTGKLESCLKQIANKGIIVRDVNHGLVDFYSYRYDQEIFLCWVKGESAVQYWHELNVGFSSRQPI